MDLERRVRNELHRRVADIETSDRAWSEINRRLRSKHQLNRNRALVGFVGVAVSAGVVVTLWLTLGGLAQRGTEIDSSGEPSSEIAATIPVGEVVEDLAIGEDAVWASVRTEDDSSAELVRLDPETHQVVERIPLTASLDSLSISEGAVWGSWATETDSGFEQSLVRIDTVTHDALTIPDIGGSVQGDGSIWAAAVRPDSESDTPAQVIIRIDPETQEEVATIPIGTQVDALRFGEGALWVLAEGSTGVEDILRIDPETNEIAANFRIGAVWGPLAVGNGAVWASRGKEAIRIDTLSNTVDSIPVSLGRRFFPFAAVQGGVWFSTTDERGVEPEICRLDYSTRSVGLCAQVPLAHALPPSAVIDPERNSIWAASQDGEVLRIRIGEP